MSELLSSFKKWLLVVIRFYRKSAVTPTNIIEESLQRQYSEYNVQRFYGPQKYFCYAPFGSMFISYSGRVSPCYACKNEESLQSRSLDEIWNGPVFSELRNQFKTGIVPEACSFCKDHLLQKNYGSILANKYDHYLLSAVGNPVIAELELSNLCNLECIMCSGNLSSGIRKNREQLPPVINQLPADFIHQFEKFIPKLKTIELTGGDPFLIDEYYQILNEIERSNPKIEVLITTNANTITPKTEALLKKRLLLSFNISIDSLDEIIYAEIRRKGSLKTVMRNIEYFSEYTKKNNTSLGFLVCPLKQNWKELPSFVDFANKYHATLSYHVVFKPSEHALWSYSSATLHEIYLYLASFSFIGNDFNSNINARSYNALVILIESWYKKAITREAKYQNLIFDLQKQVEGAKRSLRTNLNDDYLFHKIEKTIGLLNISEFPELVFLELYKKTKTEIEEGLRQFSDEELIRKLQLYHQEQYSAYFYDLQLSDNDKYLNNSL